MKKKHFYLLASVTLVILIIGGYLIFKPSNTSNPISAEPESAITDKPQIITKVGTMQCLKPKNTDDSQVASCALGLVQDDGTSYALQSLDSMTTGTIPTGQRIEVNGTLSTEASQYDTVGKISVTSIQRL